MKCDKVIKSFLNQDDSRYPSLLIRSHMLVCTKCREEIRMMSNVFLKASVVSLYAMPKDLSDLVMRRIRLSETAYAKDISSTKWLFTGVIIFASIFMVSYSESFIWLRRHFGSELEVPLNMVLGLIITVYSASFVGTHLDGAKKLLEFINNKIH